MITFNTYMTQFTCSHNGILISEKITTYLDAKGSSKKTCYLSEKLIQANTPYFTRGRLYERVNVFSIQRNICDFHKDFIFNKLKIFSTIAVTTKYLENIMLLALGITHLNPHQATSVLGQIMLKILALNPNINYRMNSLTTIVTYPWKVAV